jgi:hypothetical protein
MTRAGAALVAALVAACTGTRAASTPWVVQPEGPPACSPEAKASKSCYDVGLLAPPVVVGPGRIQVLTRPGLPGWPAVDLRNVRERVRFFVDEIIRSGHQSVASGVCPGRLGISEPASLVRLPSGESAVVCIERGHAEGCQESSTPGCFGGAGRCVRTHCGVTFAHFGVVDRAQQAVAWRWRSAHAHDLDSDTLHVAAFGDGAAIIYRPFDDLGRHELWTVSLAPNGKSFEIDDEMEAEWLAAVLVVDGKLRLVLGGDESGRRYRQLTVDGDGSRTSSRMDQAGRLTPGSRYRNAIVPDGPDVYPSTRAACGPRIAGKGQHWTRATFDDDGPLIVYTTFDEDLRPANVHVVRGAR